MSPAASGPGLDQLQHLRAETTGATLKIECFEDEAGGSRKVSLLGSLARARLKGRCLLEQTLTIRTGRLGASQNCRR